MSRDQYIEFIPNAGACLATRNVLEGRGRVRWVVRRAQQRGNHPHHRTAEAGIVSDALEEQVWSCNPSPKIY